MSRHSKLAIAAALAILFPGFLHAQGLGGEIRSLQSVLDQLYAEMLPLCRQLIGMARGLAGFAALWYIASRVWRHIANAEPIDFYPLLRPFALGLCIILFPAVISIMNTVLRPLVTGTAAMVDNSNSSISFLLKKKEEALLKNPAYQIFGGEGDYDKWYEYTHPDNDESFLDGIGNAIKFSMAKASFSFKNMIKQWLSEILHILYEAAVLCINTIRTFYLIILAVIGPIVFGLSVFDGFRQTLTIWLARYINVFLWLPVANILGSVLGKIQENMIKLDIRQIQQYGDTFFSSADVGYLIFMAIGITAYFTVPSISNYIVHAGGINPLLYKTSNMLTSSTHGLATTAVAGGAAMVAGATPGIVSEADKRATFSDANSSFMHNKLSGKT